MENLIKEHKEKFGIEPVLIGMFWNDREQELKGILEAIEKGKPYNEYEMLSKEEQKEYDEGNLVF